LEYVRIGKLRVVEEVEEFGAKFQIRGFAWPMKLCEPCQAILFRIERC
jgi:hypothetical protein